MNKKQVFEGIHIIELALSLVAVVFVLRNAEDKGIPIWGWGLLPFIAIPILVLLGTWIMLRVKPGWGYVVYFISQLTRFLGILFSFIFGEAVFIFLAGIIILWVVTLVNTHDMRLGVPQWKTRLGLWMFLMAAVLAGFAISLMLEAVLETTSGLWLGTGVETPLTIRLFAELRSGRLPDFYRLEHKGGGTPKHFRFKILASLTLTILGCALPYALLIIGRLLPERFREILPIDTGLGCFYSAGIAAIVGLSFALVYRISFSRVPIVIGGQHDQRIY